MGSSSSDKTTTVQKADPWEDAQPFLLEALGDAQSLYGAGALSPDQYTGSMVAPLTSNQVLSHNMVSDQALGSQVSDAGSSTLANMMDSSWQSSQLDAAKQNALGSAVPAAAAQFAGSGMANSTQAMDTVGRAAAEAVAPYEYDAFNQTQDRSLQAAGLAPMLDAAGYLPAQMLNQVGGEQQANQQANIDAEIAKYYGTASQARDELGAYSDMLLGYGGMGGTSTGTSSGGGTSTAETVGGAALGGLGTYGALAANPATAPFALMGGLGAGLLGLF